MNFPAAVHKPAPERLPMVDALKAVGSQLIVLHHLAFYGPMSDWTHRLMPDVVGWFSQHARMAVQVFLVVAGFLAARSLAPNGEPMVQAPWRKLGQRYVRVGFPYVAALLVAMLCAEVARHWMTHSAIPQPPTWGQFLAHAALLHNLLDVDALSAGVWYVAIDLQLYALMLLVLALAKGLAPHHREAGVRALQALVLAGVSASLFFFNRHAEWDVWAVYFFAAYGLGALAHWATCRRTGVQPSAWLLVAAVVLTAVALLLDFRGRLAVALGISLLLAWAQHSGWLFKWPNPRWVAYLSRISYAVFLLNFPVALVVNAWFTQYASADPATQTAGVLVAWLLANGVGAVFHEQVERRLAGVKLSLPWLGSRRPQPA